MTLVAYIGSVAGICTTAAYIPQVLKTRKQGGEDLSYPMLFFYLTGIVLWLVYGLMMRAPAIIWANGITAVLVALVVALKATHKDSKRAMEEAPALDEARLQQSSVAAAPPLND